MHGDIHRNGDIHCAVNIARQCVDRKTGFYRQPVRVRPVVDSHARKPTGPPRTAGVALALLESGCIVRVAGHCVVAYWRGFVVGFGYARLSAIC